MVEPVRDALIVAGGAGTRLRPLTATTPKPLLPFCGAPFLEGVLARLAEVGVERVRLVVGADPAPFAALAPSAATLGLDLGTVPEPEPLDTAGGVRAVLDQLRGTTLVLNGDILTDVALGAVLDAHRRAGAAATLVLSEVDDTSAFGVCVRDGTRIVGFVEKPAPGTLPGQRAVNAGTYVLEPAALARFPAGALSFERDVFPGLLAAGEHVEGVVSDAVWADLGTPDRFRSGHRLALDGAVRWPTLADLPADADGVRCAPDVDVAADARIVGPVLLGRGAQLASGATVGPYVVLGAGAAIGRDATVSDSVLFDRVVVGTGAHLDGGLLGHDVEVGGEAHLPAGVVVGDGARIAAGAHLRPLQRVDAGVLQPADVGGDEERP